MYIRLYDCNDNLVASGYVTDKCLADSAVVRWFNRTFIYTGIDPHECQHVTLAFTEVNVLDLDPTEVYDVH